MEPGSKKLYSLSGEISSGESLTASRDLGGSTLAAKLFCVRSTLSQSASRRTSLEPAGLKIRTKPSYADAQFVNRIRLLVTVGGASRRMTSITTGSRSGVVVARTAGRPSAFYRCFLCPTRITACWRAARHCCGALWSTVRGRTRRRSSRMLIAYPTPPLCAAGRKAWTSHNRSIRLPARRLRGRFSGWNLLIRIRTKRGSYAG